MKTLKPIPKGKQGKGLSMLPKSARNNMGFMARGGKAYAYGSTVRSPMNADKNMTSAMNPMMPRAQQQGMMTPGMMYGGKVKKKG